MLFFCSKILTISKFHCLEPYRYNVMRTLALYVYFHCGPYICLLLLPVHHCFVLDPAQLDSGQLGWASSWDSPCTLHKRLKVQTNLDHLVVHYMVSLLQIFQLRKWATSRMGKDGQHCWQSNLLSDYPIGINYFSKCCVEGGAHWMTTENLLHLCHSKSSLWHRWHIMYKQPLRDTHRWIHLLY